MHPRRLAARTILFLPTMTLAPHARSTAAALLRLLAAWLALIVLVQGLAAAQALGSGPLHRHRGDASVQPHGHHHSAPERHAHAALDSTVIETADEVSFDGVAFAITAALALMALACLRFQPEARPRIWRAARAWAWHSVTPAVPLKPPRLC